VRHLTGEKSSCMELPDASPFRGDLQAVRCCLTRVEARASSLESAWSSFFEYRTSSVPTWSSNGLELNENLWVYDPKGRLTDKSFREALLSSEPFGG
jgi:hypothetical protein